MCNIKLASTIDIATLLGCWVSKIIPVLILGGVLFFVLTVLKFMANASSEEKRKEYKTQMLWGLLAIAILISFWAVVSVLAGTFGWQGIIPQFPTGHS